ncbi:hypothetical protein TGMAS_362330 [Toxoplasma gondii MAS]|uniref:Uncharacterized protein n=1 Tax=Toxoplasma gondii MAS TaxID=943118 RepID=A0A086QAC1_TOXGO|nr:hypothetical protein TGMAS_362330 [Toxoplasma gondii MAS]
MHISAMRLSSAPGEPPDEVLLVSFALCVQLTRKVKKRREATQRREALAAETREVEAELRRPAVSKQETRVAAEERDLDEERLWLARPCRRGEKRKTKLATEITRENEGTWPKCVEG